MSTTFRERLRAAGLHTGVWLVYLSLAVALTWPLASRLKDHIVDAPYSWDALTNTMILGTRVQNALGNGAGGIYDAYFFAPIPSTIVFNENLFGLSLLFAPVYLLTGEPLLSYNVVLLWSLSLSAYFTFLLVRRLSGSGLAGFIAGAAFAFCPYVVFELGRIQLVATQWLPLTLWFLHRALDGRRWLDFVALGVSFALQVGTCLYYALFLLPLLVLVLAVVVVRERLWNARLVAQLGVGAIVAAALVVPMVWPYFQVRQRFELTRDEDYAQSHDGKLSFLANVHVTNRVWSPLRHRHPPQGAHEEIAFPGLLVALLGLLAMAWPTAQAVATLEGTARRRVLGVLGFVIATAAVGALGMTAATGTMVGGALVVGAALWHLRSASGGMRFLPTTTSLYVLAALLAVALFLGIEPMRVNGEPVHGLYYYLFTYMPGYDGIRKVSRQAITVMLMFAVLGGLGAALLLSRVGAGWRRHLSGVGLAALVVTESFSAPMRIIQVPAGPGVPDVYQFVAKQPNDGPIAVIPARDGVRWFRGHPGQALHNYFTLFHHRRTVNGKSSWIPPVTRIFDQYMNRFPSPAATQFLLSVGTRTLVVHLGDYSPERAERVLSFLDSDTEHYELLTQSGSDRVYRMRALPEDHAGLLATPSLPKSAVQVPASKTWAGSMMNHREAGRVNDGDPATAWSNQRAQRFGDWFELRVAEERPIVAIEFDPGGEAQDVPLAFDIAAAAPGEPLTTPLHTLVSHPVVRLFADQVYVPRRFVWRVVLPEPMVMSRIRITVREPVPGQRWRISEMRLWALEGDNAPR